MSVGDWRRHNGWCHNECITWLRLFYGDFQSSLPWELTMNHSYLLLLYMCCLCQSQSCRGAEQVGIIRSRSECQTSNTILFSRDYQCPFNKMRLTLYSRSIWKLSVSIILTALKSSVLSTLLNTVTFYCLKHCFLLHRDVCVCISTWEYTISFVKGKFLWTHPC